MVVQPYCCMVNHIFSPSLPCSPSCSFPSFTLHVSKNYYVRCSSVVFLFTLCTRVYICTYIAFVLRAFGLCHLDCVTLMLCPFYRQARVLSRVRAHAPHTHNLQFYLIVLLGFFPPLLISSLPELYTLCYAVRLDPSLLSALATSFHLSCNRTMAIDLCST